MNKKINYVTLKDLSDFCKIDKDLLTTFLIEKNYLERNNKVLKPTQKGSYNGIHVATGKYGEFLLYNKNMELNGLTSFRKFGSSVKKQVGDDYELFIGKYFEAKDYIVKYNGLENGVQDFSIDLIAINRNEVIFIQCKNWSLDWCKKNDRYIDQKELKSFIGDISQFLEVYPFYKNWKIKKQFIVSGPILSKCAYAMLKNSEDLSFQIIEMKKGIN